LLTNFPTWVILSKEKLAEKGVEIIQADDTSLNVRKTAFEEGSLLIFLAVGDIDLFPFHKNVLYFHPNGDFQIKPELVTPSLPGIYPSASLSPKAGQSHPNPEDLGLQINPSSPFVPPGVNLRLGLDGGNLDVVTKKLTEAWERWAQSWRQ